MLRKTKKVDMQYKGDHFLIDFMYYYCVDSKTSYTDEETDAMNLNQVYIAYAKKHNIPLEQVKP